MKSEDESIKMLEMRIQQQLSLSREKQMTPQNIQYYISSATLHRENLQPDLSSANEAIPGQTVSKNLQAGQKLAPEKTESPRQGDAVSDSKAASMQKEHEDYRQQLPYFKTIETAQRGKSSEMSETRQQKGQHEYKKALRAVHAEEFFETRASLFDGKI